MTRSRMVLDRLSLRGLGESDDSGDTNASIIEEFRLTHGPAFYNRKRRDETGRLVWGTKPVYRIYTQEDFDSDFRASGEEPNIKVGSKVLHNVIRIGGKPYLRIGERFSGYGTYGTKENTYNPQWGYLYDYKKYESQIPKQNPGMFVMLAAGGLLAVVAPAIVAGAAAESASGAGAVATETAGAGAGAGTGAFDAGIGLEEVASGFGVNPGAGAGAGVDAGLDLSEWGSGEAGMHGPAGNPSYTNPYSVPGSATDIIRNAPRPPLTGGSGSSLPISPGTLLSAGTTAARAITGANSNGPRPPTGSAILPGQVPVILVPGQTPMSPGLTPETTKYMVAAIGIGALLLFALR